MPHEQTEQDEWRRRQVDNARTLDRAIGALERKYSPTRLGDTVRLLATQSQDDEVSFAQLWRDVKEVQELFRATKPVAKDESDNLWARFNDFRDRASAAHDAFRENLESLYHENRMAVSRALAQIETDYRLGEDEETLFADPPDISNFSVDAEAAQTLLGQSRIRREDRDELRVWLNRLWAKVKALRDQQYAIRRRQDSLARLEYELEQLKEFRQRLIDRIPRHDDFIERMLANIQRDRDYLHNLAEQLDDLKTQQESAWSDTFYNKVTAWIEDKQAKITQVELQVKDRELKIEEARAMITDANAKIEDVDQQIIERADRLQSFLTAHPD